MAIDMSQSQMFILDDSEVSRMMAEKAIHDQVFRDQLLDCVSPGFFTLYTPTKRKNFNAITQIIKAFTEEIVDQAGLKAPNLRDGEPWDLNKYLNRVATSRVLLGKANTQEEKGTEETPVEDDDEWGWVGIPMCVARLAVAFLQYTLRFQADPTPFPFERLPPELRLQVYREALRGAITKGVTRAEVFTVTPTRNTNNYANFRYVGPSKGVSKEINMGLLAANRLVNNEAIAVLYQMRTFDFKTNVGGVVGFLRGHSEHARQNLHGIIMELHDKGEPDYCCGINMDWGKGGDNQAAWSKACRYIGENLNLKSLSLIINVKVPADFKSLKWVKDLVEIKGLKHLTLKADQHHPKGQLSFRAKYKKGSLSATDHCVSEHLVPLFKYLRKEMLE